MTSPREAKMQPHSTIAEDKVPLVVDLDGTLSRTDTLHETLLAIARSSPKDLLQLPFALLKGRSVFKTKVADRKIVPANELLLDPDVIEAVETARQEGRTTLLVSAADHRQVDEVAEATGQFDEAIGSDAESNLKGSVKAAYLTKRFGKGGFDYIGDSAADLPVWKSARTAIAVRPSARLLGRIEAVNPRTHLLGTEPALHLPLLKAMRPHQWLKNLLVFLPMAAAHDFSALGQVVAAFVAFCLMASSVYLMNDLVDLPADRAHPRKRNRPFAAGALPLATGLGAGLALVLGASAIAALTGNLQLLGVLWLYFVTTLIYSFWLKRKPVIDIILLAGLYTIRIAAGGIAASIVLSPWMLGFSAFLFLALAAVKRLAELVDSIRTKRELVGRGYVANDLPIVEGIALSASHGAIVILALYISSSDVEVLYALPELIWGICPLLLYWLLRMVLKTHRGEMSDDPIVFAVRDKISVGIIAASIAIVVLATQIQA